MPDARCENLPEANVCLNLCPACAILTYKFNDLMWWYIGSKAKIFRNLMCMLLTLHMSMVLLSLVSACDVLIYKFSDLTCGIGDVSKFSKLVLYLVDTTVR